MAAGANELHFHFSKAGETAESGNLHSVPAALLVDTLNGVQRSIHLIALSKERPGRPIVSRARIPKDIEENYQLVCEVPERGSFAMAARVESLQPNFAELPRVEVVLQALSEVGAAMQAGNWAELVRLLPDRGLLKRVVEQMKQVAPRPGSGWGLRLRMAAQELLLNDAWEKRVRHMVAEAESNKEAEAERETINGELLGLQFADRKIKMQPLGAKQVLEISYPEELEEYLWERRREKLQITGKVARGLEGEIVSIYDVEAIGQLDLAPIEIREIEFSGARLRLRHALHLHPRLAEESPHFLHVVHEELGLDVFAPTVAELLDEIAESLVVSWREFALADDAVLTKQARALKGRLLAEIEEVPFGD